MKVSNRVIWKRLYRRARRVACEKCGAVAGNHCVSVISDRAGRLFTRFPRKGMKHGYSHPARIHTEYEQSRTSDDAAAVDTL